MLFGRRKKMTAVETPVLVVDALGFANKIASAGAADLAALGTQLETQFQRFRVKIPFQAMLVTSRKGLVRWNFQRSSSTTCSSSFPKGRRTTSQSAI